MNVLDLVLIGAILITAFIGFRRGIIRTVLSVLGLVVGASFGVYSIPFIQNIFSNFNLGLKNFIGLSCVTIGASLGIFIFNLLGGFLRIVLLPLPFLKIIDSFIGLIISVSVLLGVIVTLDSAAQVIPNKTINNIFKDSIVVKEINIYFPKNIKRLSINLRDNIIESPLPDVFQNLVMSKNIDAPLIQNLQIPEIVKEKLESTVKIESISESCSAILVGTGFVVNNERVITNAHVVAGAKDPIISKTGSEVQLQGKVVAIDRKKDVAIIFVPGLNAEKLVFMGPAVTSENAFIAGYPNGGNLEVSTVVINSEFEALGKDIDGITEVKRDVMVFGGAVSPGNSGGPILNQSGQVLGMVFAADAGSKNIGYALIPDEIVGLIKESLNQVDPVDTGECANAK